MFGSNPNMKGPSQHISKVPGICHYKVQSKTSYQGSQSCASKGQIKVAYDVYRCCKPNVQTKVLLNVAVHAIKMSP